VRIKKDTRSGTNPVIAVIVPIRRLGDTVKKGNRGGVTLQVNGFDWTGKMWCTHNQWCDMNAWGPKGACAKHHQATQTLIYTVTLPDNTPSMPTILRQIAGSLAKRKKKRDELEEELAMEGGHGHGDPDVDKPLLVKVRKLQNELAAKQLEVNQKDALLAQNATLPSPMTPPQRGGKKQGVAGLAPAAAALGLQEKYNKLAAKNNKIGKEMAALVAELEAKSDVIAKSQRQVAILSAEVASKDDMLAGLEKGIVATTDEELKKQWQTLQNNSAANFHKNTRAIRARSPKAVGEAEAHPMEFQGARARDASASLELGLVLNTELECSWISYPIDVHGTPLSTPSITVSDALELTLGAAGGVPGA